LLYAVVCLFSFPFLFAYLRERVRQRAEQRLKSAIQKVYAETASNPSKRLEALAQRFRQAGRLRYGEEAELIAVLHAQSLFDEPCGWCEGQQLMVAEDCLSSVAKHQAEDERLSVCARCGLKPTASTLPFEK
jgi:hypothetical protein